MATVDTSSETLRITDPSTGEDLATIPAGDPAAVDRAVADARAAFPGWAAVEPAERGAAIGRIAEAILAHADELAELNARETGKLLADARGGVEAAAGAAAQYAQLGPLHRGRLLQGASTSIDGMRHGPRGVVAAIVPWNDPVAIAGQGLAAALVVGNTVVLKPSERAPLCTARLVEIAREELPDGVLGLVQGDSRAGRPLAAHPEVDVVLHTGSVEAGRDIARSCAGRGAKAILELGGNDPLVVDQDVDPGWAAEQAALGAFTNAGQICVSVERIYVHEAIAEPFVDHLVARARGVRIGAALDADAEMGPLVDERARRAVHAHVSDAVAAGARALCGGEPLEGPGCFYPPTVLDRVVEDMDVMREEAFGPVAPVQVVGSFDEGLHRANTSHHGLGATVLTCGQSNALRAVDELHAGTVKVNAVFGGAPGGAAHPRRASGHGLGYGPELLDELTAVRVLHLEAGVPRDRSGG